jgi:hypothetical protein
MNWELDGPSFNSSISLEWLCDFIFLKMSKAK